MLALLVLLLLLLPLLLDVTLCTEVLHSGESASRTTLRYACFTRTWKSGEQAGSATRMQRRKALLHALRRSGAVRRFLWRHIRLNRLDVLVLLHAGDAAHAALLTGGLQALASLPSIHRHKVHIRILPDFFRGRTTVQARSIIRFRLGILIVTMLMLLALRLQQKARIAYGTSHW